VRKGLFVLLCSLLFVLPVGAQDEPAGTEEATETPTSPSIVLGMLLVGPQDDQGWSQSHYEGGLLVAEETNAELLLETNVLVEDVAGIVEEMVQDGAEIIFSTSESFEEEALAAAAAYPDVTFIQVAGDATLTGNAPSNYSNLMAQMEWGKFAVGCAAALTTEDGKIGYVGPLINSETRRLAASAYLGAQYCYENYRERDAADIDFRVEWVGFWFYIPGETRNPSRLTLSLYDDGYDVVISGIDTPEVLEVANQLAEDGREVYAAAYSNLELCRESTQVCIGSAIYSWGMPYIAVVQAVQADEWEQTWDWMPPEWNRFGSQGVSPVSFVVGGAFPVGQRTRLRSFIFSLQDYATNELVPASFPLWQGVIRLQDGTIFANEDELVNLLDVWYLPQLLEGMEGESFPFQLEGE